MPTERRWCCARPEVVPHHAASLPTRRRGREEGRERGRLGMEKGCRLGEEHRRDGGAWEREGRSRASGGDRCRRYRQREMGEEWEPVRLRIGKP
jgi:hypothetical protein